VGGPDGKTVVDEVMSAKPQVVRIDPGDKAFKTDGCQPWQKTDAAAVPADVPPLIAGAQLQGDLADIYGRAARMPPPPP
jgi:hypothetical protein